MADPAPSLVEQTALAFLDTLSIALAKQFQLVRSIQFSLHFAQALCSAVLTALWNARMRAIDCHWTIREPTVAPDKRYPGLVQRVAGALFTLSKPRAGFLVGQFYTALLPETVRKTLGAYYTPPPLVDR